MKILIDSSTLYSAIAFPRKEQKMLNSLIEKYTIVSMNYIEKELRRNFSRGFSGSEKEDILKALDIFMSKCETKKLEDFQRYIEEAEEKISRKDAPILACAMLPDVDYLIASDKEFTEVECDKAEVLSPRRARKWLL